MCVSRKNRQVVERKFLGSRNDGLVAELCMKNQFDGIGLTVGFWLSIERQTEFAFAEIYWQTDLLCLIFQVNAVAIEFECKRRVLGIFWNIILGDEPAREVGVDGCVAGV